MRSKVVLFLMTCVLFSSFAFAAVNDSITHYYDFEESGSFPDRVGTISGTPINGPTANQPGIIGYSYLFDGTNDEARIENEYLFPTVEELFTFAEEKGFCKRSDFIQDE